MRDLPTSSPCYSVLSLPDVVGSLLDGSGNEKLIADARLERDALKTLVRLGR